MHIGGSKNGIRINCLVFSSLKIGTATELINVLQKQAEKAGLQIYFKKTKYVKKYGEINKQS